MPAHGHCALGARIHRRPVLRPQDIANSQRRVLLLFEQIAITLRLLPRMVAKHCQRLLCFCGSLLAARYGTGSARVDVRAVVWCHKIREKDAAGSSASGTRKKLPRRTNTDSIVLLK